MSAARRKRFTTKPPAPVRPAVAAQPVALTAEIRQLIEAARQRVAQAVNAGLTVLYWQIGTRIRQDILKKKRAEYGEEILPTLSAKLVPEFRRGYSARNLARMVAMSYEIVLPPLPEQTAIVAVHSDMGADIAALEARLDKTRALKQGMMQELLTGRTRLV